MIYGITCTDGRPEAFSLLEKWIGEQDWRDAFRWVVATRDASSYRFRMNQIVVERPDPRGLHPLCSNFLSALDVIDGSLDASDLVCALEDDDLYLPGYLSRIATLAEGVALVGESHARYYHVGTRRYARLTNCGHASLATTAFRAEVVPTLRAVCERGSPKVDLGLWRDWTGTRRLAPSEGHVGLKGGPGLKGVGTGHRLGFGRADDGLRVFKSWGIPDEYKKFAWHKRSDLATPIDDR